MISVSVTNSSPESFMPITIDFLEANEIVNCKKGAEIEKILKIYKKLQVSLVIRNKMFPLHINLQKQSTEECKLEDMFHKNIQFSVVRRIKDKKPANNKGRQY